MVSPMTVRSSNVVRFAFNLDANVGPGCPNRQDDVEFVQLGYFAMLLAPKNASILTPAERSAYGKILPGASYRGTADDPLTRAIITHEAARGGAQDGHVSVARPVLYDSHHSFIVFAMNTALIDVVSEYPRIDRHPRCPGVLRSSVLKALTGL
jgi:hypothetical protein